jgi:outer membrane protein OmpA-like peptidoglycan-associated protein
MPLKNRVILVMIILLVSSTLTAAEIQLTALLIPYGKSIELNFSRTSRAPTKAVMRAVIKMEKMEASIDLKFEKMEPAVLFAGDITTYVLWAVGIDGSVDNLGEIFVDRKDCSATQPFSTTKKIFALMVTAEPHVATNLPTDVVLFSSGGIIMDQIKTTPFTFTNFGTGAKPALESISGFQYSGDIPVAFKQAQKVVETAEKIRAAEVNPDAMKSAKTALANADNSVQARANKRQIVDYSRIAIQMATQAIRDTIRVNQSKAAAEAEAKRKAERAALEARAKEAESEADRIARELKEVEAEKVTLAEQSKDLAAQRDIFAAERDKVAAQRDAVAAEREAIKQERDELAGMLKGALSTVAETNETARGVIVSLPGILFDVNKATLQIPAQLTVAKLAGILMVFQNMDLSIEGYTDSTGSDELNMALSTARAKAVYDFLKAQGIPESRMRYQGFGPASPVAPNDTEVNRAKNRRVEVVLTQAAKK